MFTGIVEDVGEIVSFEMKGDIYRLKIRSQLSPCLAEGDSVAVNGACLTVVKASDAFFEVDVHQETYRRTNLKFAVSGEKVNLERALRFDSRINGHFVTGHVDAVGEIVRFEKMENSANLYIRCPESLMPFMAEKGSVAVDGISLTIAEVDGSTIKIAVIPFTLEHTNLRYKKVSSKVNLEADILARYVARALSEKDRENIFKKFMEGGY